MRPLQRFAGRTGSPPLVAGAADAAQTAKPALPGRNAAAGITLMLAALLVLTVSDALTKWLGASYPPGQIIFVRAVFALVPAAVMVACRGGLRSLRVNDVGGQVTRALLFAASSSTIALSVILLPLADAAAILYASPLFVTALAWPMLGERVDWRRWAAVLVGLLGVVIMLRPTSGVFQLAGLVPLAAAVLISVRDVFSRRLSATETSNSMMVWSSLALISLSAVSLLFGWVPLSGADLALMAGTGCLVGVGQYLVIEAYRGAEASVVAPIKYTGIVWAAIFGYAVWGTLPDAFILAGGAIVIAAGLYILRIETTR